jgi:DNA-directed RNA polymerase subunit M/transcription elongation factor TFIIS
LRCDRPSEGTGLMSFADKLYETAVRLAKYAQSSAAALEEELLQLEMRKREVEAQLDAANLAHQRLADFFPIRGADFQCPRCWIDHGTVSNLQMTAKNTSSTENYRCGTCHFEFSLCQGHAF